MKKYLLIILFCSISIQSNFCQDFKFAWIQNLEISQNSDTKHIDSIIRLINLTKDLRFVLISGNLTENGRNSEFNNAKKILGKLGTQYYILPGEKDYRWNESGGTIFYENWDDIRIAFEIDSVVFLGLNTNVLWRRQRTYIPGRSPMVKGRAL